MPTAFVTGCATGFGHALARRLLSLGWHVVASAPHLDGWPQALGHPHPRLEVFKVDVRDPGAVAAATSSVTQVDLLINNAGFALFATQEEANLDDVQRLFDVNVFGPMRVTQALLPKLRARQGTIVQFSSVAGRTVFPESGFYAATKHALEAMTEALIQEVGPLGVNIRVVEPGSFATQFLAAAAQASPPAPPTSPYAALRPIWEARRDEVLESPQDPERVVDAIIQSLEDPAPVRRLVIGADAERILSLRARLGPDAWWRLIADRAGVAGVPHAPHEVPDPQELLALPDNHPQVALAQAAFRFRHLGHWAESEEGRRALARLAALEQAT